MVDRRTVKLYADLMRKGWIDRSGNPESWDSYQDLDVREELGVFADEIRFEVVRAGDRVYLTPSQDNVLFLKNNLDYRKDISAANDIKARDLYLMNYMAIYFMFLFYSGEGADIRIRDFITKEEFIARFDDECKKAEIQAPTDGETTEIYSEAYRKLAECWLSKTAGTPDTRSIQCKFGVLNRLLSKFKADNLVIENEGRIEPTRKLNDLMPYTLRKERLKEINKWLEERGANAEDK